MATGVSYSSGYKMVLGTPIPGRYAVGVRTTTGSAGEDVTITLARGGTTFSTLTLTIRNNYDNLDDASTLMDGVTFEVRGEYVGQDITVTVAPSGGSSASISGMQTYQPDPISGIVQQWGTGAHSSPQAMEFEGRKLITHHELFTGDRFLSYGGQPANGFPQEVFATVPDADRERADTYHTSTSVLPHNGGIFAVMCDHNKKHYGVWARTPAGLADATAFALSGSGTTYVQLSTGPDADTACLLLRNAQRDLELLTITNIVDGSATIASEIIIDASTSQAYPRGTWSLASDSGSDLRAVSYQFRVNENWRAVGAAIIDTTGQAYNLAGDTVGSTATGTTATPKVSNANVIANISSGGTAILTDVIGSQRYVPTPILTGIDTWNDSTKTAYAFGIFADASGSSTADAEVTTALQVRAFYQIGGNRYVSTSEADVFGLDSSPTYRVFYAARWTGTKTVEFYIGLPPSGFTLSEDDYYNFGASAVISKYTADLSSVASGANLTSAITHVGDITLPGEGLTVPNGFVYENDSVFCQTYQGFLDQTARQGFTQFIGGRFEQSPDLPDINGIAIFVNGSGQLWDKSKQKWVSRSASDNAVAMGVGVGPGQSVKADQAGTVLVEIYEDGSGKNAVKNSKYTRAVPV